MSHPSLRSRERTAGRQGPYAGAEAVGGHGERGDRRRGPPHVGWLFPIGILFEYTSILEEV